MSTDMVRTLTATLAHWTWKGAQRYTPAMRYLHTMIRVRNLDLTLDFFCQKLGFRESRRRESEEGRYTLVFLVAGDFVASDTSASPDAELEITYNWDQQEDYGEGRNFGHLAYAVKDIHATCQSLLDAGVVICRPPRDGRMAFVRSPDGISIELLQEGHALAPIEPWISMANSGQW